MFFPWTEADEGLLNGQAAGGNSEGSEVDAANDVLGRVKGTS